MDGQYQTPNWATRATAGQIAVVPPQPARVSPVRPDHPALRPGNEPTPARPPARGILGRRAVLLAFWIGLAIAVAPWWFNTPAGSITSAGAALTAAGRVTGLIGGYILLLQLLMMSRMGWLDRQISGNQILSAHRDLGATLVTVVVAHMVLILFGYARIDQMSVLAETWTVLTTFEDMISAFVATGLLIAVGGLAARRVRQNMRYETWYLLHLTSYGVLLFSYGHMFASGSELIGGELGRIIWIGLFAIVLACLAWGRIVAPTRLNLRHRLQVADVVPEGKDMFSLYIQGQRLDELNVKAGHFFRWRFLTKGCWSQAHPFSLSAAPNGRWLRLTIKIVGDHTEDLRYIRAGVRVLVEGPSGTFTADHRLRYRALLIAGGSGIAPIRALLEEMPPGAVVIYRASAESDLVFRNELDWLAARRGAQIIYVVGGRDDPWPRKAFSPKGLRQLVPDVNRRDIYLCGPEGLVNSAVSTLHKLRVPRRQIHLDPFEF